jgi:hypothetical protein
VDRVTDALLVQSRQWFALSWVDWTSVIGFAITLAGLWFTWKQARDARGAAEAASEAVDQVLEKVKENQISSQIGQLRWIVTSLDDAIKGDEASVARLLLSNWRHAIGQVGGMLRDDPMIDESVLVRIQESVGLAASANSALVRGGRTVARSCEQARVAIGEAYDVLNHYAAQRAYSVERSERGVAS